MKKRIQKYLSGSNEGFSLVELIIVIAIMAILVGVVALAVIPYLEKSRESKDLQALDTVASAASTAVADMKVTGQGQFTIQANASGVTLSATTSEGKTGDAQKVYDSIMSTLGDANLVLGSNSTTKSSGDTLYEVVYSTTDNVVYVYVPAGDKGWKMSGIKVGDTTLTGDVACCQYNDNAPFCISNAKVTNGTAAEITSGS